MYAFKYNCTLFRTLLNKKKAMPHDIALTVVLWLGTKSLSQIPKLSSFRLVVLLVDDAF